MTIKNRIITILLLAFFSSSFAGQADPDCTTLVKKQCKKFVRDCKWVGKNKTGKGKKGKCKKRGGWYCLNKDQEECESKKYRKICKWDGESCTFDY